MGALWLEWLEDLVTPDGSTIADTSPADLEPIDRAALEAEARRRALEQLTPAQREAIRIQQQAAAAAAARAAREAGADLVQQRQAAEAALREAEARLLEAQRRSAITPVELVGLALGAAALAWLIWKG